MHRAKWAYAVLLTPETCYESECALLAGGPSEHGKLKNVSAWLPTKYTLRAGKLRASRRAQHVSPGSRLIADRIADRFGFAIREHCRGDLLDLGCGQAPLYLAYRDLARSVTCVDWGNSKHDVSHADVLCDLNERIPLPDASFDTIILSDVLEHLFRPQTALSEIRRMLRPGGKLLMSVPFLYSLHEKPYDYFRYTQFGLERMADEARLHIVALEELGGAPEVFADFIAKLAASRRVLGPQTAAFVQVFCRWFTATKSGARISRITAKRFPLGYFLIAEPQADPELNAGDGKRPV